MSRFKVFNLIDKIFITVTIFLLTYAWVNFFIRNLWITFLFSVLFSWAIMYLLLYIVNKKNAKKFKTKTHIQDVELNFLAFRILDKFNQLNLIKTIIDKQHQTQQLGSCLLYKKDGVLHEVLIAVEQEKLSQNELINLISLKEKDVGVLQIICQDYVPNLNTKILKNLTVSIITKNKLYDEFFVAKNLFPDCAVLERKNTKINIKNLAKNFLTPNKAKSFFMCGLVLIFSSIILPYHWYYLIFGTVFFILSILCKLLPYFKR